MNKVYRLIWNDTKSTWDIAPETARARGKRSGGSVTSKVATVTGFILKPIALSFALLGIAHAAPGINELPTGGQLSAGTASISQTTNIMTINQSTNRAAVNWSTFNVGAQATININQPTSSSVLLNRVNAANPSQIFGQINANGQVFLTNPSGIHFAPGSSLNVGGLVATTHSISDTDFMAGNDVFNRDGATGSILNEGDLTAALNGYIALLAPEVRNEGIIIAQLGTVALAAGEAFELQFDSNNTLANIRIEPATIDALVENGNAVHAPSGLIILSAQAINTLQGGVVNNTGSLEATGLTNNGGVIRLEASDTITHTGSINVDAAANSTGNGGTATIIASLDNPNSRTVVDGSLSAKAGNLGGGGGFIETSASHLTIGDNTRISTSATQGESGTWLLDPVDFTIAASGGDMTGATLSSNLGENNVTIASTSGGSGSAGDVNVNDTVTWSAHKLTLNAQNDININADMTATGTASLALEYGQGAVAASNTAKILTTNAKVSLPASTANFTTKLGSDGAVKNYTVITSLGVAGSTTKTDLQGINGDLTLNYALGADIDATATSGWNAGAGFSPLSEFFGEFDGLGHTISNLTINRPTTNTIGLFSRIDGGVVRNIGIASGTISGQQSVGGLIGIMDKADLYNSFSSANVLGTRNNVGGLIGLMNYSTTTPFTIDKVYATGTVTYNDTSTTYGSDYGGLIGGGTNTTNNIQRYIKNSYATGAVTGRKNVGGLLGSGYNIIIEDSYSTGNVNAKNINSISYIGGLVGYLTTDNSGTSKIIRSYSTSVVDASTGLSTMQAIGGLVGSATQNNGSTLVIDRSYATGEVKGRDGVGGLLGGAQDITIQNSYATGSTTATDRRAAGLVGTMSSGSISNSYATGLVTGPLANSGGLIGLLTRNMYQPTISNSFWDTQTTGKASLYGELSGAVPVITNSIGLTTTQMQTALNFTSATVDNGSVDPNWDTTTPIWKIVDGSYPCLSGIGSCTAITLVSYTLSAIGTGSGNNYKGSDYLLTGLWSTAALFDGTDYDAWTLGTDYSFSYNSGVVTGFTDAATYNNISIDVLKTGYALAGTGNTIGSFVIDKAALSVTASADSKTYDGLAYTGGSGATYSGFVNSETSTALGGTLGFAGTSQSATAAGTYAITPNGYTSGNYTFSYVDGVLTVNKAPLTVTAAADSKTYDGLAYTGGNGATYSGFVNSETSTDLSGTLGFAGTSQSATAAGTYAITPNGYTSDNYTFSYVDGVLTILPKPVSKSVLIEVPLQLEQRAEAVQVRTNTTITQPENKILTISGSVITVSLESMPNTSQNGIIVVSVPRDNATSGEGFSFSLPKQLNEMAQKTNTPAKVTMTSGEALPSWLEFDAETMSVKSGAVPTGAYPIEVSVSVGSDTFIVVISEKATE